MSKGAHNPRRIINGANYKFMRDDNNFDIVMDECISLHDIDSLKSINRANNSHKAFVDPDISEEEARDYHALSELNTEMVNSLNTRSEMIGTGEMSVSTRNFPSSEGFNLSNKADDSQSSEFRDHDMTDNQGIVLKTQLEKQMPFSPQSDIDLELYNNFYSNLFSKSSATPAPPSSKLDNLSSLPSHQSKPIAKSVPDLTPNNVFSDQGPNSKRNAESCNDDNNCFADRGRIESKIVSDATKKGSSVAVATTSANPSSFSSSGMPSNCSGIIDSSLSSTGFFPSPYLNHFPEEKSLMSGYQPKNYSHPSNFQFGGGSMSSIACDEDHSTLSNFQSIQMEQGTDTGKFQPQLTSFDILPSGHGDNDCISNENLHKISTDENLWQTDFVIKSSGTERKHENVPLPCIESSANHNIDGDQKRQNCIYPNSSHHNNLTTVEMGNKGNLQCEADIIDLKIDANDHNKIDREPVEFAGHKTKWENNEGNVSKKRTNPIDIEVEREEELGTQKKYDCETECGCCNTEVKTVDFIEDHFGTKYKPAENCPVIDDNDDDDDDDDLVFSDLTNLKSKHPFRPPSVRRMSSGYGSSTQSEADMQEFSCPDHLNTSKNEKIFAALSNMISEMKGQVRSRMRSNNSQCDLGFEDAEIGKKELTPEKATIDKNIGNKTKTVFGRRQNVDGTDPVAPGPRGLESVSTNKAEGKGQNEETEKKMTKEDSCDLSIYDVLGPVKFSALLCVAPEDIQTFAMPFLNKLAGWGLRVCFPERDLCLTGPYHENLARVIKERCNGKVIVIVSHDYPNSDQCLFLTHYAIQLDPAVSHITSIVWEET